MITESEVKTSSLPRTASRAEKIAIAMAIARRYVAGPDVLEPPNFRAKVDSWLVPVVQASRYTEWTDPLEGLSVYSVPQGLRPDQLVPVVRRVTWFLRKTIEAAETDDAFDASALQVQYYSTRPAFIPDFDRDMRLLATRPEPSHGYNSISPLIRDNSLPIDIAYVRIQWATRAEIVDLQWAAEDYPVRTKLWAGVWARMEAECEPGNLLVNCSASYEAPPDRAPGDPSD